MGKPFNRLKVGDVVYVIEMSGFGLSAWPYEIEKIENEEELKITFGEGDYCVHIRRGYKGKTKYSYSFRCDWLFNQRVNLEVFTSKEELKKNLRETTEAIIESFEEKCNGEPL